MYGWRARIGLILPMDNAVIEPELYKVSLNGISFYSARLSTHQPEEMPRNGIEIAKSFNELGTDIIVYTCAATSFRKGVDENQEISQMISEVTNQPAFTASSAMVEAARYLNVKKASLVTPYNTEEKADNMIRFFEQSGIAIHGIVNQKVNPDFSYERYLYETNLHPSYIAYRMAKEANEANSEAIIVGSTNFQTFEMIKDLEADLQKPVITNNQAILWYALQRLNINVNLPHLGELLTNASISKKSQ